MNSPRHTVTVQIAGESHTLRSDVSPDYTRTVAAYLDDTARKLGPSHSMEARRAVLLAGLTITEELFRAREELERVRREMSSRTDAVAERLEAAAGEETGTGTG